MLRADLDMASGSAAGAAGGGDRAASRRRGAAAAAAFWAARAAAQCRSALAWADGATVHYCVPWRSGLRAQACRAPHNARKRAFRRSARTCGAAAALRGSLGSHRACRWAQTEAAEAQGQGTGCRGLAGRLRQWLAAAQADARRYIEPAERVGGPDGLAWERLLSKNRWPRAPADASLLRSSPCRLQRIPGISRSLLEAQPAPQLATSKLAQVRSPPSAPRPLLSRATCGARPEQRAERAPAAAAAQPPPPPDAPPPPLARQAHDTRS